MPREWIHMFGIAVLTGFGSLVLAGFVFDRWKRLRVDRLLRSREPLDAKTFAQAFFAGSAREVEIAAKLRDVLAANLEQRLDGLRPEDRLDEDLHAELIEIGRASCR